MAWVRGRVLCTGLSNLRLFCSQALFTCSHQHLLSSYVRRHWGPYSSQDPRSGAGPPCADATLLRFLSPFGFLLSIVHRNGDPLLGPLLWFPLPVVHLHLSVQASPVLVCRSCALERTLDSTQSIPLLILAWLGGMGRVGRLAWLGGTVRRQRASPCSRNR